MFRCLQLAASDVREHVTNVGTNSAQPRPLFVHGDGARQMADWRTIDSAPKDGSAFLGYLPQFSGYAADQTIQRCTWTGWGGGCWDCQFEKGGRGPTHWMPLPTPPVQS